MIVLGDMGWFPVGILRPGQAPATPAPAATPPKPTPPFDPDAPLPPSGSFEPATPGGRPGVLGLAIGVPALAIGLGLVGFLIFRGRKRR
jgi:hypothetical protein